MSSNLLFKVEPDNLGVDDWSIVEKPPTREIPVPKPTSLQDAVDIIRATFSEVELQAWAALPRNAPEACVHFSFGLWIRNQWVHGNGSPLAADIELVAGFIHEDSISGVIIEALWRVLNGLPCPVIEELVEPSVWEKCKLEWGF